MLAGGEGGSGGRAQLTPQATLGLSKTALLCSLRCRNWLLQERGSVRKQFCPSLSAPPFPGLPLPSLYPHCLLFLGLPARPRRWRQGTVSVLFLPHNVAQHGLTLGSFSRVTCWMNEQMNAFSKLHTELWMGFTKKERPDYPLILCLQDSRRQWAPKVWFPCLYVCVFLGIGFWIIRRIFKGCMSPRRIIT